MKKNFPKKLKYDPFKLCINSFSKFCSFKRSRVIFLKYPFSQTKSNSVNLILSVRELHLAYSIRIQDSQSNDDPATPDSQHCKLGSVYITTLCCKHLADFAINTPNIWPRIRGNLCYAQKPIIQRAKGHTIKKLEYVLHCIQCSLCGHPVPEKWSGREYNFS